METPADGDETQRRKDLDVLMTQTFNSVLHTEEKVLANHLTKGLTITEVHTIVAVGLSEVNPMSVVAARLGITLATLTTAVNKLVDKGYIERQRGTEDRRQVLIRLTRDGRRVYRAHGAFHHRMIDDALEGLTVQEEDVLFSALGKVKTFFDGQAT